MTKRSIFVVGVVQIIIGTIINKTVYIKSKMIYKYNHRSLKIFSDLFRYPCEGVEQAYIFSFSVQLMYSLAYLLIFLVGVVGNLLVVVAVLGRTHMRTTTNMYILNMAAADILMCLGKCLQPTGYMAYITKKNFV
jgi:hypothetical protein